MTTTQRADHAAGWNAVALGVLNWADNPNHSGPVGWARDIADASRKLLREGGTGAVFLGSTGDYLRGVIDAAEWFEKTGKINLTDIP